MTIAVFFALAAMKIPSHQARSFSAWNGVETRGQAPEPIREGESIVQTTNRKGGESRSGKALAKDNVVQLAIFQNSLDRVGKDTNAKTKMLSAWLGSKASAFCANTGTTSNTLQFGLPVVFSTSASRLSAGTTYSMSSGFGPIALRKATDRLRKFDVPTFADGSYVAVVNPRAMTSLLANPDTKQWYVNYQGGPQESMFKGQIKSPLHGVSLIMSTNIPRYATSAISANIVPVIGAECLAVTELGGLEMIVKRPGDQNTNDPFNLFSTVAYKFRAVAAVTNPSAGVILITNERT